ncbi:uncharacterized protein LOC107646733 [Arachis ipaensis]|uniref:uncharacterized protein LOC107646733 n=1 Tax=Arachis ipaensis TaxID=130454 RepID=UPI000A2B0C50|nr:uncharacterized protein LOC107646733 [Arachis ipaensis]
MTVVEYMNKFEELCRFSEVCQGASEGYEDWKCIKYEGGLQNDIMSTVVPMEIRSFFQLVNKSRVVKECSRKTAIARNDCRKFCKKDQGKSFAPRGQEFKRSGHAPQYSQGHLSRNCPRRETQDAGRSQQQGQIFATTVNDAARSESLIRGICKIGNQTLVALYDTGASHSFISHDRVDQLGLKLSELACDLHVHTPASNIVITKLCAQ